MKAVGRAAGRPMALAVPLIMTLALFGLIAGPARANLAPALDPLNRTENPLSNGGKWLPLSWGSGAGRDFATGWAPVNPFPAAYGAYWTPSTFSDAGTGEAVEVTVAATPKVEGSSVSLWLNMSSPGSVKSGYQLSWKLLNPALSTYLVSITKWAAGVPTLKIGESPVLINPGARMALVDSGSWVEAFQREGPFGSSHGVKDSTFSSGYAGIEASDDATRLTGFGAGAVVIPAPSLTGTKPASPANDNAPAIVGSAESGSDVALFTNSSCSGSPLGTWTANSLISGIPVSVADDSTTTFYATASFTFGTSACSATGLTYTEDSTAPAQPTFSWTAPASPGLSTSPKIAGSAESGSTVKLYTTAGCTGPPVATGSAAAFASPGLTASVASNSSTTYRATATDAAGNTSVCSSTSKTYVNDAAHIRFEATRLSDFVELQRCNKERIKEVPDPIGSGRTVMSFTVYPNDIAGEEENCEEGAVLPTGNPRANALSHDFIEPGDEFWLRSRFLIPSSFPAVEGWLTMIEVYGAPHAGTSPWRFHLNSLGGEEGDFFSYQRNATYGWDIPWAMPRIGGTWVEVLTHEKFASNGFVEQWIDGEKVTFFGSESPWNPNEEAETDKLEMATVDSTNNGHANSVRIGQYREYGEFEPAPIYYEFVKVGTTKESVGG